MYKIKKHGNGSVTIRDWHDEIVYSAAAEDYIVVMETTPPFYRVYKVSELDERQLLIALARSTVFPTTAPKE